MPSSPALPFRLRPATAADAVFLGALYRAGREAEVAAWGWSEAQADAFIQMQADVEQRARALAHPGAEDQLVVADGAPIGRLLVDRSARRILIVDVALMPRWRGQGIGAQLIAGLLDEGRAREVPVMLSVRRGNRAETLYRRLGFSVTGEDAVQRTMACYPPARDASASESRREECLSRS